jgi:hypothetical protein
MSQGGLATAVNSDDKDIFADRLGWGIPIIRTEDNPAPIRGPARVFILSAAALWMVRDLYQIGPIGMDDIDLKLAAGGDKGDAGGGGRGGELGSLRMGIFLSP